MRIDAHQHFWRLADRAGHWPPPALAAIHRDFMPADLEPLLGRCGVDGTVLVQSLPNVADTRFMLDLADRHAFIRGVVGWVDLKAPDVMAEIAGLASHSKLRGLRPMLQDLADDDWIDDVALGPAVTEMQHQGLCFDALVLPRHLPALLKFARRHQGLNIVIDHASKPDIAGRRDGGWSEGMAALAALPHVHCKLSGLLTEAGETRTADDLSPWVRSVLAWFGPQRVLWGSDWPVLRLAGDYAAWLDMSRYLCETLLADSPGTCPAETLAAIFGGNAVRLYRLDGQIDHQPDTDRGTASC